MSSFKVAGSPHMSLGKPAGHRIAEALLRRAGPDAGAADVADVSVETWHEIDAALAPIIGQRGVGALYSRSLHLTETAYPWLAGSMEVPQPTLDVQRLRTMLSNQPHAEAADASAAVLHAFHTLLTQLIGALLTEQLLRSVWARFLSGDAAQDLPS